MGSINDALKRKFNATGSNIAETLSNIESTGPMIVQLNYVYDSDSQKHLYVTDKTWKEINTSIPNVIFAYADPGTQAAQSTGFFRIESFGVIKSVADGAPLTYQLKIVSTGATGVLRIELNADATDDDQVYSGMSTLYPFNSPTT